MRQAAARVAAAAGGFAGESRAPVSGAGGAGVTAGDEQRHDRPVADPDPQEERRQRLAPPTTGLQRRAAAGAGAHVQGLGRPQRSRLAGDRPCGPLRRPDGGAVPVDPYGNGHRHRLEREPADPDARRSGGTDGAAADPPSAAVPLRGIDADNDPVFMNQLMEAWCDSPGQQMVLTRSRDYKSNDQAWVEQKNEMLVRRVVSYQQLVSLEAGQVLGELYGALRLFTNLFRPLCKFKSSERDGGRIKRQHHPPRTPLQRLLATGQVSEERGDQLRELQRGSDPLALLETIRRCQGQLAVLGSGEQGSGLGPVAAVTDRTQESRSLKVFLGDLQTLWQSSQPRRRKPWTRTGKRTRPVPFESDVALIEGWLEKEPQLGTQELMERLVAHNPQRYSDRQLRTLQRRLRSHRLQRIELEIAETCAVQGRANRQEAGDPSAAIPVVPLA